MWIQEEADAHYFIPFSEFSDYYLGIPNSSKLGVLKRRVTTENLHCYDERDR
jgi:hypothetical protein